MEDLAIAEPYELEVMQNRLKEHIKYARRHGEDTEPIEIELSYVQREIDIRHQRERFAEKMRKDGFHFSHGV